MKFLQQSFTFLLIIFFSTNSFADENIQQSRLQYIEKWKDEAIKQMYLHKIPASITLAQGCLESRDGLSRLAAEGNNHFGIKCSNWNGSTIIEDDETKGECFRKYKNAIESFEDHSIFLKKPRYASLFENDPDDYKSWAAGLKKAGYATNPQYPQLLIKIIEECNLNQYDEIGMKYIKTGKYDDVPRKNLENNEEILVDLSKQSTVKLSSNRIKYVVGKTGDTYEKIAEQFDMGKWQILRYNDLNDGDKINDNDIIYLQPKRNRASQDFHTVKLGDTMRNISQKHGVNLRKLYKKNRMILGTEPEVGKKVSLKKNL
jgi:LysM repeat protein